MGEKISRKFQLLSTLVILKNSTVEEFIQNLIDIVTVYRTSLHQ